MSRAEELARSLLDGLAASRANRHAEAARHLRPVCEDRELAASSELEDVRARACSLLAQALFHTGQFEEAEGRAEVALRLVRRLGDTEGIDEITQLLSTIRERASKVGAPSGERRDRLVSSSIEEVLAIREPGLRCETLLQKATAELSVGELVAATTTARKAWTEAEREGRVRVVVLARICAAHADPLGAVHHLDAAWRAADASAEAEQLLGPVARAAELLGLPEPGEKPVVGGRA